MADQDAGRAVYVELEVAAAQVEQLAVVQVDEKVMPMAAAEVPALCYESGILPAQLVASTRSTIRAACITQEAAARRIGISRPQLANAPPSSSDRRWCAS